MNDRQPIGFTRQSVVTAFVSVGIPDMYMTFHYADSALLAFNFILEDGRIYPSLLSPRPSSSEVVLPLWLSHHLPSCILHFLNHDH